MTNFDLTCMIRSLEYCYQCGKREACTDCRYNKERLKIINLLKKILDRREERM